MATGAELGYNRNASAIQMAQEIFGDGVTVTGASYSGDNRSSAIYSNGDALSPDATPSDTGVILSTGRADRFTQSNGDPNRSGSTSTNTSGVDNDSDFNSAAGTNTFDASFLEVDFTSPSAGVMTMQFIFASEEYPEFTNSLYQDMVGVWINGTQVDLSVGDGDTDPSNLNGTDNSNLFVDNTGDDYNTEMDGFTVTMTMKIPINAGTNSIKIGIADVADSSYDSNLLIASGSMQTAFVANDDELRVDPDGSRIVDVLANDTNATVGTLTVTHINGQPVSIDANGVGTIVTLPSGQQVQINADGTLTIVGDGDTEDVSFTYTAETSTGVSDTAFVLLNMVPCFVAGTLIQTADGQMPVDALEPGDMIMTRDRGAQPLRWIGERTVPAVGALAPVEIDAGTFGDHKTLRVSPLHRILIQDRIAELLFGEPEVLVAARQLVNDHTVRVREGGEVTYVHLMFDQHEIVISNGLESESFLPGGQITNLFEQEAVAEIATLFPELDLDTGEGYSPAARRILKRHEAELLAQGAA